MYLEFGTYYNNSPVWKKRHLKRKLIRINKIFEELTKMFYYKDKTLFFATFKVCDYLLSYSHPKPSPKHIDAAGNITF